MSKSPGKMAASSSTSSTASRESNDDAQIVVKEEKPDDEFVSPCRPIYGRRVNSEAAQRVPSINCKSLQKVPDLSGLGKQTLLFIAKLQPIQFYRKN